MPISNLRDNWIPPLELRGGIREVRVSGGGKALLALAAVIALAAIAGAVALSRHAASQELDRRTLEQQGVTAQAVVTRLWHAQDGKETRPMVSYDFQTGGQTYSGRAESGERTWKQLTEGAPLEVHFLPSDPTKNHPTAWRQSVLPRWIGLIVLFFLLPAGLIQAGVRRHLALAAEGRAAPAIVTRYSRSQQGRVWHYEFAAPGGETGKGKGGPSRNPPPIGSTVTIIFDPERPRRNAPYPLQFARIERG